MTRRFQDAFLRRSRKVCRSYASGPSREAGFHRVDLCVCIALVLLFGVLGVAAFSHGERDAKLAKCRNNLWELHKASVAYGDNHGGDTPPVGSSAQWAWDFSRASADELVSLGARRHNFYCPSLPSFYSDPDFLLYWDFFQDYRVIGYVMVTTGVPGVDLDERVFATSPPRWVVVGPQVATNFSIPEPERLAYIVDATLSIGSSTIREDNTYTGIVGASIQYSHRPAHMRGGLPEGGNLMMLDGHAEWRGFEKMKVRNDNNSFTPAFWW